MIFYVKDIFNQIKVYGTQYNTVHPLWFAHWLHIYGYNYYTSTVEKNIFKTNLIEF